MREKMKQRLMNEDRTSKELRHDLERITEPKHVQRNTINPLSLQHGTEFLKTFNVLNNITDGNSPNLLDDQDYDCEETELGPELTTETPITSNTTPSDFLTQKIETTAFDNDFTQEPEEEQDMDDNSLAMANNVPFQTTTQDFERTLERAT
jgi:hypothetical protein